MHASQSDRYVVRSEEQALPLNAGAGDFPWILMTLLSLFWYVAKSGRSLDSVTLEEVDQALIQAFEACSDAGDNSTDNASQTSGAPPSENRSASRRSHKPSFASPAKGIKRGRHGDEPPDGKKARIRGKSPSSKGWLCPYYCSDRITYHSCLRYKLLRIIDVRRHILRVHVRKPHCPTCYQGFESDSAREHHIREQSCQPRQPPSESPAKATMDQWESIRQRASYHHLSRQDEDRWFDIWDILFPLRRRPSCPSASHSSRNQFLADSLKDFCAQGRHHDLARQLEHPWCLNPNAAEVVYNIINSYTSYLMQQDGITTLSQEAASSALPPLQSLGFDAPLDGQQSDGMGIASVSQAEFSDFQSQDITTIPWPQSTESWTQFGSTAPLAPGFASSVLQTNREDLTGTRSSLLNYDGLPSVGGQENNTFSDDPTNWVLQGWNQEDDIDKPLQQANFPSN